MSVSAVSFLMDIALPHPTFFLHSVLCIFINSCHLKHLISIVIGWNIDSCVPISTHVSPALHCVSSIQYTRNRRNDSTIFRCMRRSNNVYTKLSIRSRSLNISNLIKLLLGFSLFSFLFVMSHKHSMVADRRKMEKRKFDNTWTSNDTWGRSSRTTEMPAADSQSLSD